MSEQARRGKRLALRFAMVQLGCSALAALACLAWGGFNAARSAAAGGLIIAVGTMVLAWQMFATGWPAGAAVQSFYRGEVFKWVWTVGALSLAFYRGAFETLPLLIGLMAGQVGFWVAIGVCKQT